MEDGVWDGGIRGKAEGREAIREFFVNASRRLPFAVHMVMNPIIEVDGDTATGTWYLFQPCTYSEGDRAVWGSARYDEEYVRVNGGWMFRHLKLTSHFWTPLRRRVGQSPVRLGRQADGADGGNGGDRHRGQPGTGGGR